MKLTIEIEDLQPGMFVLADVLSILVDNEIRHFLDFRDASFEEPGSGRIRLMQRKYTEVANTGGLLVRSAKQIMAFTEIGLSKVTIDTDKSDVVPDIEELRHEHASPEFDANSDDDAALAVSSLDEPATGAGSATRKGAQSVEVGATGRRNFGSSGTGWMKVETDYERGEAVMSVISFGGDGNLSAKDVRAVLEDGYGITSGVDEEMVKRLAEQAGSSPNRVIRGHFPVAVGQEAPTVALGGIEYTFMDDVPEDPPLAHGELRQAFDQQSLPQVMFKPIPARLVMPGEELAVFASSSAKGVEVTGEEQRAEQEAVLKAGANVNLVDGHYVSQVYGYVCLIATEISVIPPIWVTPDRMEAHFIKMPVVGPPAVLTKEWLAELFEFLEVRHGLAEDGLERIGQLPTTGSASVLVARGSAVGTGEPGKVYFAFKRSAGGDGTGQGGPGGTTQPGSSMVEEGELLAELTNAAEETAGMDLAGNALEAEEVEPIQLIAGLNVRREEKGRREYFYAEKAGRAREKDGTVRVHEVTYIEEDVAGVLQTEKDRDVVVRGSVRAGAEIVAGGSLHIEGMVERGAKVRTQEDIVVDKGIIGHETSVVAMGDVQSSFVQSATVVARGDVTIDGYLLNAKVRAGGRLVIQGDSGGGERSGSGIGGELTATLGIEAGRIGSGAAETKLTIVADPTLEARIRKADEGFKLCRTNILRIFRTLGISDIDATHFKRMIEESPPNKRKAVIATLSQLKAIVEKRSAFLKQKRELESTQAEMLEGAEIVVRDGIASDVEIRFGKVMATYSDKLPATVFSLAADTILQRGR